MKTVNIKKPQLMAEIHEAANPARDHNYIDTHPDSKGLIKQGTKGPTAPYIAVK